MNGESESVENSAADANATVSLAAAIEIAQALHRRGYLDQAEGIYRQILDAKPDSPEAQHFLGVLLHQLGQSEAGEKLILAALETNPDYIDAISNLGNIYYRADRLSEAGEMYYRAITLKPDFYEAHLNLATLCYSCGRYEEAIAEWEVASKLSPGMTETHETTLQVHDKINSKSNDADSSIQERVQQELKSRVHESMANALMRTGRTEQALAMFRRWQQMEPDNPKPRHIMAYLTGTDVPLRASNDYIKWTFNRFARSFDSQLGKLEYSTPSRISETVKEVLGEAHGQLSILDAGCGTGLCAVGMRPFARRLVGVDLSTSMLEKARDRGLYDELTEAEITEYLSRSPKSFDLIISADTLIYFGDLSEFMTAAVRALRMGGHIVFSVENAQKSDVPNGYHLLSSGRYGHAESYVRGVMQQAGLDVISIQESFLRKEEGSSVMGWLAVGRRSQIATEVVN